MGRFPVLEYRSIPPEGNATVKACRHVVSDEPSLIHGHGFLELVYVESGSGFHTLDGAQAVLSKGDLCIVKPGQLHSLEAFPVADPRAPARGTPFAVANIILDARFADSLLDGIREEDRRIWGKNPDCGVRRSFLPGNPDHSIAHIAALLIEETNRSQAYASELSAAYAKALLLLVLRRSGESGKDPARGEDLERIRRVEDFIRKYPDRDLSLPALADRAGTCPRNLERLFKKVRGSTVKEAVKEARMQEALNLVRFSALPIRSISERVGFSDPSHFYRIFKKTYGTPPSGYRR